MSTILKSYSYKTLQGPYLNLNEDLVSVDFASNLFLLVDGFGGQGIGDRICQFIDSKFSNYYNHLTADPDSTLPLFFSPQFFIETNALANALKRVHQDIFVENMKQEPRFRGGASLTAVSISDGFMHLCSLGSNMVLIIRGEEFKIVDLPETNSTTGHQLTENALGMFEYVQFKLRDIEVQENDKILILSDGIHSKFSVNELHILTMESRNNEDLLNNLIGISNTRGNKDNVSGIILNF